MSELNGSIAYVNDRIEEAAQAAGVWFVDVEPAFRGHAICDGFDAPFVTNSTEWINGITQLKPNLSPGDASFHPKTRGQVEYAKVIEAFIDDKRASGSALTPAGLPANPPAQ